MRRGVVVDASVAVKWFVAEPDSAAAERLLGYPIDLHAPLLLMSELANALWKKFRKGFIDEPEAEEALRRARRTVGQWHPTEALIENALRLSLRFDHPVYDFLYVSLAERLGMTCVTADLRLVRKIEKTEYAGRVVPLAQWQPA